MKKESKADWLDPLRNRPNLYLDEKASAEIEMELTSLKRKRRSSLFFPSVIAVAVVLFLAIVMLPNLLSIEHQPLLSAELREQLQAFEEAGEPIYHLTNLPFEPQFIQSELSRTPSGGAELNRIEVLYIETVTEKVISLHVFFLDDNEVSHNFSSKVKTFNTKQNKAVTYETKDNGIHVAWEEEDASLFMLVTDKAITEQEIETMVDSLEIYE